MKASKSSAASGQTLRSISFDEMAKINFSADFLQPNFATGKMPATNPLDAHLLADIYIEFSVSGRCEEGNAP
jgi:hypothetical protein